VSNAAFLVAGRDADIILAAMESSLLTEEGKQVLERIKRSTLTRDDIAVLRMPAHMNHRAAQDRLRVAVDLAHQQS